MKIKVGLLFGGSPRYRDFSIADTRHLLSIIDSTRFDVVPLFIDEKQRILSVSWSDTLQFNNTFPTLSSKIISPDNLSSMVDVAFITIQEDMDWLSSQLVYLQIPHNTPTDNINARDLCHDIDFCPVKTIPLNQWQLTDKDLLRSDLHRELGFPLIIKAAGNPLITPGMVITPADDSQIFTEACRLALRMDIISASSWNNSSPYEKNEFARLAADPIAGLGFPIEVRYENQVKNCHDSDQLLHALDSFSGAIAESDDIELASKLGNPTLNIESDIDGVLFTCITYRKDNGSIAALTPFQVDQDAFVAIKNEHKLEAIRSQCRLLFAQLSLNSFANFSGIVTPDGKVIFYADTKFIHLISYTQLLSQARELGLATGEFFNFIIRLCIRDVPSRERLLFSLDDTMSKPLRAGLIIPLQDTPHKQQAGILFDLVSATTDYKPVLIAHNGQALFFIPPQQLSHQSTENLTAVQLENLDISASFGNDPVILEPEKVAIDALSQQVDLIYYLHDNPSTDEIALEQRIKDLHIPLAGSDVRSRAIVSNQHKALDSWKRNGLKTPEYMLCNKADFDSDADLFYRHVESTLIYPFIAAMPLPGNAFNRMVIPGRPALEAFTQMIFRNDGQDSKEFRKLLRLKHDDYFPTADTFMLQALITELHADFFSLMEVGITSKRRVDGGLQYEVFEATEIDTGKSITQLNAASLMADIRPVIEKAAGILMLQGNALITFIVRALPGKQPEIILLHANPSPGYTLDSSFLTQAINFGYKPVDIITQMFNFARSKHFPVPDTAEEEKPDLKPTAVFPPPSTNNTNQQFKTTINAAMKEPHFDGTTKRVALYYFQGFISFLTSAIFLRNLLALLIFGFTSVSLIQLSLNIYTRHNESLQVHDYVGMPVEEAISRAGTRNFVMVISDSIFMVDQAPGIVLDQTPKALSRVKEQRRIYLTVSKSTPDLVTLPELVGSYNFDQYARKLAWLNVRAKVRERQFDAKQEENTILHFYLDGQKYTEEDVRQGLKVPMGAELEFVVTERLTGMVAIPNLVCKTYEEAMFILTNFNLNIGEVFGAEGAIPDTLFIWKQDPPFEPELTLPPGRQINIYLTKDKPVSCIDEVDF
jgi:D-alanine-D-alanine ligase-like ATP-grasp enzyme